MSDILKGLEPARVLYYFEQMSRIPHGSHNTKAISDYLVSVAESLGLRYVQDAANNIVIYKPASKGLEDKPTVILQGHMDMVTDNDPDVPFDWSKDALKLKVDGDWLKAEGTTLGGDDGVAIAIALAVLEDKELKHPALEALFTVDEEIGLVGANALDGSLLKGRIMLNLDSEGEGVFLAGCAGGATAMFSALLEMEEVSLSDYDEAVLAVTKLRGGHSGAEIHWQRGNANIIVSRIADRLVAAGLVRVKEIAGGSKDNAIPYMSVAKVLVPKGSWDKAEAECKRLEGLLREEFGQIDPELTVVFKAGRELGDTDTKAKFNTITRGLFGPGMATVFTPEATHRALSAILGFPNGIITYNRFIPGLVETSLNLGILSLTEGSLKMVYGVRSGSAFEKEDLLRRLELLASVMGLTMNLAGSYPPWAYRAESPLRETMVKVYRDLFDKTPAVETIHAGLECGIFSEKLPGLDAVAFGPDLVDIHTTGERLSLSSLERTFKFVKAILEELAR